MSNEVMQPEKAVHQHNRFLRDVAGTAGVRLAGLAIGFGSNIVLARLLGKKEYGTLVYILAWVGLFSVVGMFGLDRLLVREVSRYRQEGAWGLLSGLLRWTYTRTVSISLCIAAVFLFIKRADVAIPAAGCLLLCTVTLRISGSALCGFNRVVQSQYAEVFIQPALGILCIVAFSFLHRGRLLASQVLAINAAVALVACIVIVRQLFAALPKEVRQAPAEYVSKCWFVGTLPLFFVCMLDILSNQLSSLLLGSIAGSAALGVYSAADKCAQMVLFPLAAVNMVLSPAFARLYSSGDTSGFQKLVTRSARLIFVTTAPIALVVILFGHWSLLIFGNGFTIGRTALTILCIGQLINASIGSVGNILMMTGHGRETAIGVGAGACANLALGVLLIPRWGANGAAVATAVSLVVWNVVLAGFVWKRLGVFTTALGCIGRRSVA